MFGTGLLKGMGVTLREFVNTYLDDIKKLPSRYAGGRTEIDQTAALSSQDGLFTIQYPEEHRKLPERFRFIPFLVYEETTGEDRCTACGICAKVCPPQCIWIVRDRDANGRPVTRPSEFYIDASICMNCGLCAEYCPFDAIKMDHRFEITAYERMPSLIYGLQELRQPTTYYAETHPVAWGEEQAEKAAKEAAKAKPATSVAPATTVATQAPAPAAAGRPSPEELERRRAEARARKAAAEGGADVTASAPAAAATPAPGVTAGGGRPSPEELEARRAAARARKAAAEGTPAEPQTEAPPPAAAATNPPQASGGRPTPEELEARRAAARARKAAAAQESDEKSPKADEPDQ
jgi:NADH-quinone oxidoreductase subunit I